MASVQWWYSLTSSDWPYSEQCLFTAVLVAGHLGSYWLTYAYYKLIASLPSCQKYLIPHPSRKRGNPPELLRDAFIDALVSTLVLTPIAAWFVYPIFKSFGTEVLGPLPSGWTIARDLVLSTLFTDTTFYWAHRLLHHPLLYAPIHKQHHKFQATEAVASQYDHPIEDIVNTLTTVGGPLLLGSHVLVVSCYIAMRIHQTLDAHSGYELPFPLSPWAVPPFSTATRRHDYHHTENCGNYGDVLPFWDWLCGTDSSWKASLSRSAKKES